MIEAAGFVYDPPARIPNSLPSLFLGELARDRGCFDQVHSRLFAAYWSESKDIGDIDVLEEIASSAGIESEDFAEALRDSRYASRIVDSTGEAHRREVTGVPAWLIDNRLLVMGAQPHEEFESILRKLGYKPQGSTVP